MDIYTKADNTIYGNSRLRCNHRLVDLETGEDFSLRTVDGLCYVNVWNRSSVLLLMGLFSYLAILRRGTSVDFERR